MDISIQKKFGHCIRYYRQELGLSQEKFSLKIGMDRTYYSSVEAGKRNISIANIQKIAELNEKEPHLGFFLFYIPFSRRNHFHSFCSSK